jgi:superfamily II DNA or RNA helicase
VRTESRRTLVIFDEIHHGPFRSDDAAIPFVRYEPDGNGVLRSAADHTYGYADTLADGVVRPVVFLACSGETRWRDSAGEEYAARLGEPASIEHTTRAWRTALDPAGEWMPAVISAADTRLRQLRDGGVPDAGGMIIASDQKAARAYAVLLERLTGEAATVVVSDDIGSSDRIATFSAGTSRWLVAVRMVSEGVDVPRLAVGVYATSASTPLYFAQAIGRFVRSRRPGETASVFLPSVPSLLQLVASLRHNAITCWASRTERPTNWRPRSAARPSRPKPTTRSCRCAPTRNSTR